MKNKYTISNDIFSSSSEIKLSVIFDFNGTLANSWDAQINSWNKALTAYGLESKMGIVINGLTDGSSSYQIASQINNNHSTQNKLVKLKRQLFDALFFEHPSLYPNEMAALDELHRIAEMHILSLYSITKIRKWLNDFLFTSYFKTIYGRNNMSEQINKSDLFDLFLANNQNKNLVFIGDTESDCLLSRENNIQFLLMNAGKRNKPSFIEEINYLFNYDQLVTKIQKRIGINYV